MLSVNNLSVNYGSTRVVDKLNLELGQDEILMLVGPTGCGKTTILQALAGLIPISEGSMSLGNWQSTARKHVPPEKRNVGMVFQDFALFPHLTVQQNVCFRLKDTKLADHWLKLLGLDNFRDAKPARLSGGQKQRVALARTLAHEPSFVLLDEPLSNLDAALKDSLRWEIRDALKKAGVPAIWVTHDQEEALSVGDRVGILNKGVLEQLDTPEACYSSPASRFVARFMGEASFLSATFDGSAANVDR
ncbi:MAG: ABC transporter ATP-binding protein, partial [Oceanospirillaceae bacterium]|nr:ABC transporter ATP-binding protein [Oceanospirillaceae bacterium]